MRVIAIACFAVVDYLKQHFVCYSPFNHMHTRVPSDANPTLKPEAVHARKPCQ